MGRTSYELEEFGEEKEGNGRVAYEHTVSSVGGDNGIERS